jgi:hypothetical protein
MAQECTLAMEFKGSVSDSWLELIQMTSKETVSLVMFSLPAAENFIEEYSQPIDMKVEVKNEVEDYF